MKKIVLLVALILLSLPTIAGSKTIDESRAVSPDVEVHIELIAGAVRVVGWDRDEVRVQGTINDQWEEFEMDGDETGLRIDVSPPRGRNRDIELEADLEIRVPVGAEVTFETVSASFEVSELTGSVGVETVIGDVKIGAGLQELVVESVSGKTVIAASRSLRTVEVEIVSGNVEMRGDLNPTGDYSFSSVTGEITLHIPADLSADYEIETFSGKILNEFGPKPKKDEYLPSLTLSFTVGSGDADVSIESINGAIRLLEDKRQR